MNFVGLACTAVLAVGVSIAAPPIEGQSEGIETDPVKLSALPHSEHHTLGCVIDEPKPEIEPGVGPRGAFVANVINMIDNGDPDNRLDLVFVGDGYLADELAAYETHCQTGLNQLFATPPFSIYQNFFNAHRVEVISNESGVDHDPTQGTLRDTALDMGYWCGGIERLLCVNTFFAYQYANNAPDIDQVFAVGNSAKYGGAGYPSSDLGTYAGGNGQAPGIAIHELGHAMGDLADEYTYGGPTTYAGGEPTEANASIFDAASMSASQLKWHDWLGESDEGGTTNTFEGCNYSLFGIYRPSNNSIMRSLGRPFNNVSTEQLIIEIYKQVDPIDSASPPGLYNSGNTIELQTVNPVGHALTIQWFSDGLPIAGANGNIFAPGSFPLAPGQHAISVTVVDETTLVRDETARDLYMSQSLDGWTVTSLIGDINSDCVVDTADLGGLIGSFGGPGPFADLNGDNVVDTADLGQLIASFGQSCN